MNQFYPAPQFAQFAPQARKNYRDIPNQYDRMGQVVPVGPGALPGNFVPPGFMPGFNGLGPFAGAASLLDQAACNPSSACCNPPAQTNGYERVIGLPRICIGGCESETAQTSVCGPFTLTNLYVAPRVAHLLSITRFQVGCNNFLVNCDPIPAELFSCCELDENIVTMPTVDANSPICIEFENESSKEVQLKAALKGIVCISCQ